MLCFTNACRVEVDESKTRTRLFSPNAGRIETILNFSHDSWEWCWLIRNFVTVFGSTGRPARLKTEASKICSLTGFPQMRENGREYGRDWHSLYFRAWLGRGCENSFRWASTGRHVTISWITLRKQPRLWHTRLMGTQCTWEIKSAVTIIEKNRSKCSRADSKIASWLNRASYNYSRKSANFCLQRKHLVNSKK